MLGGGDSVANKVVENSNISTSYVAEQNVTEKDLENVIQNIVNNTTNDNTIVTQSPTNTTSYNSQSSAQKTPSTTQAQTVKKDETSVVQETKKEWVLNTNTKKFHYPGCKSVKQMKDSNKKVVTDTRDNIIKQGYSPCGNCKP